ncbi:uncharacterized protein LOC129613919 [Condylostylus longicornis]|uniref:uncharacterized protein LOC129613919 n=1 Tax=Condylostylus longicornis TaxID=2530218 RepID=UPI00244DDB9C|nr:uncharacterized protein LOC129613919 [Condylostylus longicornis]
MRRKFSTTTICQISLLHTTLICLILIISLSSSIKSAIVPPPWSDPEKNPCALMPGGWQLLYWPPLKKCFKIFSVGYPCPDTMELSPATLTGKQMAKLGITAECKCPPGTAQSRKNQKCYQLFEQGPCSKGEYFNEAQESVGRKPTIRWGKCEKPRPCPKGMLFWPRDTKCYTKFTRGPCRKGKLLVLDDDEIARCACSNSKELKEYFFEAEETCHEHFTKGPCTGHGHIFLPGGTCGCNPLMPHYHYETNQCYELGTQGPCPQGHIYTIPDDQSNQQQYHQPLKAKCQCRDNYVLWQNDGICYRLYTRGPCDAGEFLVNSTNCIKNTCGKGRLFFPEQKSCFKIGSQGPCSLHEVVIFDFTAKPSVDGISYNGICGCSGVLKNLDQQCTNAALDPNENTCESSPGMVELNGKCYKLYTRGPCGPGQWLEPFKINGEFSEKYKRMTSRAKCQCRPGYENYQNQEDNGNIVKGCYAPNVGIARYLNHQYSNYTYKFRKI